MEEDSKAKITISTPATGNRKNVEITVPLKCCNRELLIINFGKLLKYH